MDSMMKQYAEVGAKIRLSELDSERARILELFPSLSDTNGNRNQYPAPAEQWAQAPVAVRRARRARHMTEFQRQAVSKRMKAYWRKKRAEKTQVTP
jgi:hypothetical protein